jgi:hypothetical protein
MESLFNEYEASCSEASRKINEQIREVVAQIFDQYQEKYTIRELEYIICQTIHCQAAERILTRAMAKRKASSKSKE